MITTVYEVGSKAITILQFCEFLQYTPTIKYGMHRTFVDDLW